MRAIAAGAITCMFAVILLAGCTDPSPANPQETTTISGFAPAYNASGQVPAVPAATGSETGFA
jgi:hypothetical protein